MGAEIAVLQPVHEAVGQIVEGGGGSRLVDCKPTVAEGSYRHAGHHRKRRVGSVIPVNIQGPDLKGTAGKTGEIIWRTHRWQIRAVSVSRQQAAISGAQIEEHHLCRRIAGKHFITIHHGSSCPFPVIGSADFLKLVH